MRRSRGALTVLVATLGIGMAVPCRLTLADAITRVRGTVADNHGKPLPKVPIYLEATEIKKKVGPVRTNKGGTYTIATLDVSVAKKWRVVPEVPGYKTVKVSFEIVDSGGEERGKGEVLLGSKQEFPELQFALVGDEGRNVVDLVLAKEAEFAAAVQEERKKRTSASTAGAGGTAPAAPGPVAVAPAPTPPPAPPKPPPGGAQSLEKAKQLADAGRNVEAISMYRDYLTKDPTSNPAVYYYLGKSLFESGDDPGAEQAFRKGLELRPDMKGAHFYLGNIFLRQERLAEAVAEYEKETTITPDSDSVYFNLGQAHARAGEDDQALAAFEKTAAINPAKSEAYMNMASIYEKKKDNAKAEEMYQKVISIDPKNAAVSFFNLGVHAWNENRAKEAAQAFRKALEIDAGFAVAHRELARALMGSQDFAGAIQHFQEYLKLNPQAPDAGEIKETIALLKR